jgi:hypothetical protein
MHSRARLSFLWSLRGVASAYPLAFFLFRYASTSVAMTPSARTAFPNGPHTPSIYRR